MYKANAHKKFTVKPISDWFAWPTWEKLAWEVFSALWNSPSCSLLLEWLDSACVPLACYSKSDHTSQKKGSCIRTGHLNILWGTQNYYSLALLQTPFLDFLLLKVNYLLLKVLSYLAAFACMDTIVEPWCNISTYFTKEHHASRLCSDKDRNRAKTGSGRTKNTERCP